MSERGADKILEVDLKRINELAKKAKTVGLTSSERKEQQALRKQYLKQFRNAFKKQLHGLTVIDEKGNDITPEKLKKEKKNFRYKH